MTKHAYVRRALHSPLFTCTLALTLVAAASQAEEKPTVVVLATGGTIAGAAESSVDKTYDPSKLSVQSLLASVPQLAQIAEIRGEQVAQISSQDMDNATWLKLDGRVNALLKEDAIAGVVITHGTDTMEETAFFLDNVTDSLKPIVLVGAMRPATSLSADGPLNLYNAVAVAGDPASRGRGVLLVMHDDIHSAHDVTKTHTTRLDTFDSPNGGTAGEVHFGKARFYASAPEARPKAFDVSKLEDLPRVDIIYAHAGMDGKLIEAAAELGAKGIVLAGVGNGNLSKPALEAVAKVVKQGVVVVRSNRTGSGETTRNHEIIDDELGTFTAGRLNPQKARVLLQLALTQPHDAASLQKVFDRE